MRAATFLAGVLLGILIVCVLSYLEGFLSEMRKWGKR